jgi:hypothetical protein
MNTQLIEKVLREHGYAKLAYEVLRERGQYVPRDASVHEHVLSLTIKMAQDRIAQRKIRAGIEAYRKVVEG